ncbi:MULTISPECIES: VCBS domain-containing protein [Aliiglaciecola]|uniref:VCBS domain-containing protein n=1 Tax=Aliiglaciecola TaxID=1406885 RepID=UPI001C097F68|nr:MULTISPECIES: VCBS domain-containing protein [Aliiglaciecola]MBU2877924.1 VCBS domain-containing protein [Aliiglaciecola lipolytica]MDO6709288.1 VCBS domain-containing protein [Aliiglaciecola sp. 2_MG-2023]MDO6750436.1 VCBS domain-containing protein [Aliiglaciecola sp. 1_MG-2023]
MNNLKNIFTVSALALALSACGTDSDNQLNVEGGVSISGETTSGQTLTAQVRDVNGVNESAVSYQWLSAGVAIPGATSNSYVLADSDIDSTITVTANYTDNDSFDESVVSAATEVIKPIVLNVEGVVEITGTVESGQELTAVITDDNGLSLQGVSYAWLAGTDSIGTDAPTVTLTNDEVGKTVTVTVTYVDNDGFAEDVTSEATNEVAPIPPVDAEFSGDLSVTITSSEAEPATGTAIVTDLNEGESSFEELSDITTTYGVFSITASGAWTYTLDTNNATVAALTSNDDDLVDTIILTSFDGTTSSLLITITGADLISTKVVKLTDTNINTSTGETPSNGDIGELKLVIGDQVDGSGNPLASTLEVGKLSFLFKHELGENFDSTNELNDPSQSARVGLYGDRNNTARALIELRFLKDGDIAIRDNNDQHLIDQKFELGEWVDVAITWDATNADGTVTPTMNVSINGTPISSSDPALVITNGSYSSFSTHPGDVENGVLNTAFRLGDSPNPVTDGSLYIDDLKIYSDVEGTTLIFEDDFEAFDENTQIHTDTSTYHSGTNEAIIVTQQKLP